MSRVGKLIAAMTLAEKLGQMTMTASSYAVTGPVIAGDSTRSIRDGTLGNLLNMVGADHCHEMQRLAVEGSRLGIPLLIGLDIIHGHRTLFPVPLAEVASFDPKAWAQTAREAALEGAADGLAMTFAPMLDVSRDPRWGRGVEGPGENSWLGTRLAEAKVRGFQGDDLSSAESLAACAKHFCAYGPVTAGREYAAVDISERTVHEVHLPPFAAAIDAGVATIMPSFTDLAGIPMTVHVGLLRGWLREKHGFDGVIVSDYNAIGELINHGVAADLVEAATLSLKAGVDIDMMSDAYRRGLPTALERGWVTMEEIDAAVHRVLTLKERLGLFDDPYRRGAKPETPAALANRRRVARDVSARSIVMLKNDGDTLPLGQVGTIAVIGPLANAPAEMGGAWGAAQDVRSHVAVLAGLRNALHGTEILHEAGVDIQSDTTTGIPAAVALCERADAIVLCIGEAANMSGEAASRAQLDLPGQQRVFAEAVLARARELGKRVVVVLFSGRPLVLPWLFEKADAVLAAWFLGSEAGNAIADVLTGRVSPTGRTPMAWPAAVGQVPVFFGQRPSGRPFNPKDHYTSRYLDIPNEPLFPFGHGLTYGRFVLSNLRVTPDQVSERDTLEVRVDVTNEGARRAEETVFLFTHDKVASVTRPLLELKGFGKIALEPGASGTVALQLRAAELRFLGLDMKPVFEAGEVEVLVGPCADRAKLLMTGVKLER
ncbi:MAG TPA: glycoside hydrolase family 3 N-terminal domain-containing protein [Steroidobacteraceae bacterium]|nr:glycoside hydrolase family 3 N-terminal domain-containing protein [Steroidobacteraceae bacterium]